MPNYKRTKIAAYTATVTQAVICAIAPLLFIIFQDEFGLTDEQTGRLILLNFGTQIFADILATKYADRIGYRPSIIGAHILCLAGMLSMSVFPAIFPSPYVGLCFSVVLYAFGGGFIEVLNSPIVEALPGDEKASAMSLLHSFFCWGTAAAILLTTSALKIFGNGIWRLLPVCWSVVPLAGVLLFAGAPISSPAPEGQGMSVKDLLSHRAFWIALLMMLCAGSSELTMSQWASLFAEKGLQVDKFWGDLLGPFLFAITMGTGRALYGHFGSRIDIKSALTWMSAMCVICYVLAVFGNPVFSLLGCALCGFSVSLMWPGTLSATAARYPLGGTAMFGVLAIFGDIGASVGPWLAGAVSDLTQGSAALMARLQQSTSLDPAQLGLKAGLLVGILFPAALFVCALCMKRTKPND
ncbi:MAG: MFS transporter [Eubacteriales bacterium]|nr:MFS transporter [Eubacteriales bacterium]